MKNKKLSKQNISILKEAGLTDSQIAGKEKLGGSLDLQGTGITNPKYNNIPEGYVFEWRTGKYIKVDGIMTEVLHKRGNIRNVRVIGKKENSYLVTDGNGKWAHGTTIKEAKDLLPILKKHNAYGLSKFEKLLTFN